MNFVSLAHRAKFLLNQNSSTILTGIGVVGTVGTAYLTGKASFRSAELIAEEEKAINHSVEPRPGYSTYSTNGDDPVWLTKKDKVKIVWRCYVPAVGAGVVTVSAIIVAHRIDAKRIVALTVASGISERAFKEYREKVVEKLGERQDTKIRDSVAQDRVNQANSSELIITSDGNVLCMEALSGRFFESTPEKLNRAINQVNHMISTGASNGVGLSEFYDEIGLSPTAYSELVGWNPDKLVDLKISATVAPDGRPCLVVDYEPHPFDNYNRLY